MPGKSKAPSIRGEYEKHGAAGYYREFGKNYRNPHEEFIVQSIEDAARRWPLDLSHVLDLAAGSGEVTLALRDLGAGRIDATDPFTADAYLQRTGSPAEQIGFAEIAVGALTDRRYSLIVCSFALHLCEKSRLPAVAQQLSEAADALLVLTPHKRPEIRVAWGWNLVGEAVANRVRARYYLSARCADAAARSV